MHFERMPIVFRRIAVYRIHGIDQKWRPSVMASCMHYLTASLGKFNDYVYYYNYVY